MLEALFSSRVRVHLLTVFLLNPDSRFHARLLTQRIGAQYSAIWKELAHLERAGVLLSESSAHIKAYYLNSQLMILPELRSIILKTVGAGDLIRRGLEPLGVHAAFIYGSFAAGNADPQSDIDLMLIGQVDLVQLAPIIARLEEDLGREVNYIAYSPEEWRAKQRQREPFIENVLTGPKVMLLGDEDALRATRPRRTHQALQGASRRASKTAQAGGARSRHRRAQPGQ